MSGFGRLSTPIHPIMDNMFIDVHFFSVPMRQLWTNFRKFCGEQEDPGDSIDYTMPIVNVSAGPGEGTFEDHIGIPIGNPIQYNALFYRAYQHIFNEWYRDQNLVDSQNMDVSDATLVAAGGNSLLVRGKRHDYFTSCLPWPQKGTGVTLPLGTEAPVIGFGILDTQTDQWATSNKDVLENNFTDAGNPDTYTMWMDANLNSSALIFEGRQTGVGSDRAPNVRVDLTNASSATINQLRESFQIQKLLERDARAGTRYAEVVKGHFGVDFIDLTYRPEFLGGGTSLVNINPVAQTSSTDATTPKGDLSAFGTVGLNNIGFNKSFNEHCIVMGIASVRADLTYQQGLNRMFPSHDRFLDVLS